MKGFDDCPGCKALRAAMEKEPTDEQIFAVASAIAQAGWGPVYDLRHQHAATAAIKTYRALISDTSQ